MSEAPGECRVCSLEKIDRLARLTQEEAIAGSAEGLCNMHTMLKLWQSLRDSMMLMSDLRSNIGRLVVLFERLDDHPRHDTILSDDQLKALGFRTDRRFTADSAERSLSASIKLMRSELAKLQGRFEGQLKVGTEDRFKRLIEEAEQLRDVFSELADNGPVLRQPYSIRRAQLIDVLLVIDPLVEYFVLMQRQFARSSLPAPFWTAVRRITSILLRTRADLRRWRDNPSQKLGSKMAGCNSDVGTMVAEFQRLRNEAMERCRDFDIAFYNRVGVIPPGPDHNAAA